MVNLTNLNDNQREAVINYEGIYRIIAAAGSGKTSTLIKRIEYMIEQGINPYNILAITFSKKATDEMKNRLYKSIGDKASNVTISTFHALGYRIIQTEFGSKLEVAKDYWQKQTIEKILDKENNTSMSIDYKQALKFISNMKNNLITYNNVDINECATSKKEIKYYSVLKAVYKEYEKEKEKLNLVDFDDMIIKVYYLLKSDSKILNKYKERFKYILADEYQDANKANSELIKLLGEGNNVFIVGDHRQSIYKFRGSRPELFIDFENTWKEYNPKTIFLDINYRCSKNIIDWSNKLISHNQEVIKNDVKAFNSEYKEPLIQGFNNEYDEAESIAKQIKEFVSSGQYSFEDVFILYRTNAQSQSIEDELISNNIPYVIIGGHNFINRKEIKDITAYLQLIANPYDDISLRRIINTPSRFLGKVFLKELESYCRLQNISLFEGLKKCPIVKSWKYNKAGELYKIISILHEQKDKSPYELIKDIRELIEYDDYLLKNTDSEEDDEKLENLNVFQNSARQYETLDSFLNYIDYMQNQIQKNENAYTGKVQCMTFHKSKGLESPIVFLAGCSQGLIPHRRSLEEGDILEERRLMYVGITRAKKELIMNFPLSYNNNPMFGSQFLKEVTSKEFINDIEYKVENGD